MPEPSQQLDDLAMAVRQGNQKWRRPRHPIDAGFGFRGFAALIDVVFLCVAAVFLFFFVIDMWIADLDGAPLHEARASWILEMVIFVGAALYLACEAGFGFTIGKLCLGLKVIPSDSSALQHPLLMRWIFRCLPLIPGILGSIAMLAWIHFQTDSAFVENFGRDFVIPLTMPLTTLLTMYLLARIPIGTAHQVWYDRAAGTRVVRGGNSRTPRGFEPIINQ